MSVLVKRIEAETQARVIVNAAMQTIDLLHRIYMRVVSYFSPAKECRTIFGSVMLCRTRDFVQRRIRFFGIFEHNLTYYTLSKLRDGDVYLDLGANVGYFTLLASKCVGESGKVFSIEADPQTFGALENNITLNKCSNVRALNIAVTDYKKNVMIERADPFNSGKNSIQVATGKGCVEGLPFRELVPNDLQSLSFIKIDIEGAERPVLESILNSLDDLRNDIRIASEISGESADIVKKFIDAGFDAYAIPNVYTIDYYLVRDYLAKFGESKNTQIIPVSHFDSKYTDYILERRQA